MKKIEKSVLINAPINRVFEFLTDPNNYPAIWPSMVEVKNAKREPEGKHSFDWTYKMVGIQFHGHADASDVEKNRRVVSKNEAGIPSTFVWTYQEKDGGTEVGLSVEYELPKNVLTKLAEPLVHRLNEREADTMLQNAKAVLEHQAAKAAE